MLGGMGAIVRQVASLRRKGRGNGGGGWGGVGRVDEGYPNVSGAESKYGRLSLKEWL